jgi:nucleotide-binding universal stress UspA family protein
MSAPLAGPAPAFELGTDGPSAIVVGVDGSETSLRALAYAAGLARRQGSRLVAVYVRTMASGVLVFDRTGAAAQGAVEAQDHVEQQLRATLEEQARAWQVQARLVVRGGDPLAALSDVARKERADAVIVGSSEGLGHRLAGSLAVRLVRCRRWPVTVVP